MIPEEIISESPRQLELGILHLTVSHDSTAPRKHPRVKRWQAWVRFGRRTEFSTSVKTRVPGDAGAPTGRQQDNWSRRGRRSLRLAASGVGPALPHSVPPLHATPWFLSRRTPSPLVVKMEAAAGSLSPPLGLPEKFAAAAAVATTATSVAEREPEPPRATLPRPWLRTWVAECREGPRRKRWRGRSGHEGGARGEPEGSAAAVKDADREAGSPERGRETGRRIVGRPRRRCPGPSVGRRASPTWRLPVSFLPSREHRGSSVLGADPSFLPLLDSLSQGRSVIEASRHPSADLCFSSVVAPLRPKSILFGLWPLPPPPCSPVPFVNLGVKLLRILKYRHCVCCGDCFLELPHMSFTPWYSPDSSCYLERRIPQISEMFCYVACFNSHPNMPLIHLPELHRGVFCFVFHPLPCPLSERQRREQEKPRTGASCWIISDLPPARWLLVAL